MKDMNKRLPKNLCFLNYMTLVNKHQIHGYLNPNGHYRITRMDIYKMSILANVNGYPKILVKRPKDIIWYKKIG
jgi:hypothetical protein